MSAPALLLRSPGREPCGRCGRKNAYHCRIDHGHCCRCEGEVAMARLGHARSGQGQVAM